MVPVVAAMVVIRVRRVAVLLFLEAQGRREPVSISVRTSRTDCHFERMRIALPTEALTGRVAATIARDET
jgi:hypothetical protein